MRDMDETSRLIANLQQKLQELDHKVCVYRHDMTSEYTKYAEGLLKSVPEAVSNTVRQAIAESMSSFPSLAPVDLGSLVPSRTTDRDDLPVSQSIDYKTVESIPLRRPMMTHSASEPAPRSPHARDEEFHGVFTPTYLPLLDSRNGKEAAFTQDMQAIEETADTTGGISFTRPTRSGTPVATSSSYTPESPIPKLPIPRRRNTDEIGSTSDRSTKPRSALRRNSSSSKNQSPRRVRFEFEGEQFATTSSPRLAAPISDAAESEVSVQDKIEDDFDDEAGCEMVEDIAISTPPKKVSSTQALRALSRDPIADDGTQWTPVSAPPDGSASIESSPNEDEDEEEEFLDMRSSKRSTRTSDTKGSLASKADGELTTMNGSGQLDISEPNGPANAGSADPDIAAEEDDVLAEMTPLQPMRSQRSIPSPVIEPSTSMPTPLSGNYNSKPRTVATKPSSPKNWLVEPFSITEDSRSQAQANDSAPSLVHEDEEDLFGFDDESPNDNRHQKHYIEHDSDKEESVEEDKSDEDAAQLSQYSRSPARGIVPPKAQNSIPEGSLGRGQNSSFRSSGGSLRVNHPFSIPVVSEAVHAEAARMGPLNSFVGSLSGKSGPDASDMNSLGGMGSFRAGSFAGAPMSLSERMKLEDYMEEQKKAGSGGNMGNR